jgi:hypothetical protein
MQTSVAIFRKDAILSKTNKIGMQLTEEKERNARPFLCTYSSACLLPHP